MHPVGLSTAREMNMKRAMVLALGLAGAIAAGAAFGQAMQPAKTADGAKGPMLVDQKGMTLYVFDKDEGGKSACNGPCAKNWPPLAAAGDARPSGEWTVVTRDDGARQWAYGGKPLYTWAKDTKAGDVTGDGVNTMWHIAHP